MVAVCTITLAAGGCSTACPAIGYVSSLEVAVVGGTDRVSDVRLCTDQGCSAAWPTPAPTPAPSIAVPDQWVPLPNGGFSPAPEPNAGPDSTPPAYPEVSIHGVRQDQDTWTFTFVLGPNPDHITLRALSTDGALLAEQEHDLEWTVAGGYAPCPGPVTTPPLTLRLQ